MAKLQRPGEQKSEATVDEPSVAEVAPVRVEPKKQVIVNTVEPKKKKKFGTFKKVVLIFVLVCFFGGGVFAYKIVTAMGAIFTPNISGSAPALSKQKLEPKDLKGEGDGRINILLLGIPGADSGNDAPNLSDTIIIASIDPKNQTVAMLSVPRDLYVAIPGHGSNKINVAHVLGELDKEGSGPLLTKKVVAQMLNVPIHYYVRVDFSGFEKAINDVGGIDVNVPKAIYDSTYPNNSHGYSVFSVKAGEQHMSGATALKYARSRHTTSDFDRALRQQLVITAFKEKISSLGFLTNPAKVMSLIETLGKHVRTDLSPWEIGKMAEIFKGLDLSKVNSAVLSDAADSYLTPGWSKDGMWILKPRTGDYAQIQKFVHSLFKDEYLATEAAKIEIQNGTGIVGLAKKAAEELESYGYLVVGTSTATKTDNKTTQILDYAHDNPFTVSLLQKRLGVEKVSKKSKGGSTADIVIILGEDYLEKSNE